MRFLRPYYMRWLPYLNDARPRWEPITWLCLQAITCIYYLHPVLSRH